MTEPQDQMVITGERTVPGIWHENYWFRRHEVVYERLSATVRGRRVLDAGCGEGYGADLLAKGALSVHALDYDDYATEHVQRAYSAIPVLRGNLVALPLADTSYDVVASLQTIEHLWDQDTFVAECVRVLRPGGRVVISTPNTLTFPPGNIYHPGELTAAELAAVVRTHSTIERVEGLHHGERIRSYEGEYGPVVDAQVAGRPETWPVHLRELVASVTTSDFELRPDALDESLDLVVVATKP